MKHDASLQFASILSIVLFLLHIADDIVRGMEPGDLSNYGGIVIAAVWLYVTLALAGRRSGYLLLLLVSVLSAAIPVIHMRGRGLRAIAESSGGLLFTWTLLALGTTSLLAAALALHGLWSGRRARTAAGLPAGAVAP